MDDIEVERGALAGAPSADVEMNLRDDAMPDNFLSRDCQAHQFALLDGPRSLREDRAQEGGVKTFRVHGGSGLLSPDLKAAHDFSKGLPLDDL